MPTPIVHKAFNTTTEQNAATKAAGEIVVNFNADETALTDNHIVNAAGDLVYEAKIRPVDTIEQLKALPTGHRTAYLTQSGRAGVFKWDASVLVTAHQIDTKEAVFVAPNPTLAGAWVRQGGWAVTGIPIEFGGAVGDGVADDAPVVQAMAPLGPLVLGQKTYLFATDIAIDQDVVTSFSLRGHGPGLTKVIYTGVGTCITLSRDDEVNSTTHRVGYNIEGIDFNTNQAGLARCLYLDLDNSSPNAGAYEGYFRNIQNCAFTPLNVSSNWLTCVELHNSYGAHLNRLSGRAVGNIGNMIVFSGTKAGSGNKITQLNSVGFDKVIFSDAEDMEGTFISQMNLVSPNIGVEVKSVGNNPQLIISDTHIDALQNCIKTENLTSLMISNTLLYALQPGCVAVSVTSTSGTGFRGHQFSGVSIFGNSTGRGYEFLGTHNGATITGGSILTSQTGIFISAGSRSITVDPFMPNNAITQIENLSAFTNILPQAYDFDTQELSKVGRAEMFSVHGYGNTPMSDIVRKTRGTRITPSSVVAADKIWRKQFEAYDGTNYVAAGYIEAGSDGTPATGAMPSYLDFGVTQDGSSTATSRLKIRENGAVEFRPPSDVQTLDTNGKLTFEFTNDTTLTFRARGNDGTTRSGTITLA